MGKGPPVPDPETAEPTSAADNLVAELAAAPAIAIPTNPRLVMLAIWVSLFPRDPCRCTRAAHRAYSMRGITKETAMIRCEWSLLFVLCAGATVAWPSRANEAPSPADYSIADKIFDEYRLDAHAPGLVYGI